MENILDHYKLAWLLLGVLLAGWMIYNGQVIRTKGQEEIIVSAIQPITVQRTAVTAVQAPVLAVAAVKPIVPPFAAVPSPKEDIAQPAAPVIAPILQNQIA